MGYVFPVAAHSGNKQGPVAQLVSAPPCHGGGREFKSRQGRSKRRRRVAAKQPTSFLDLYGALRARRGISRKHSAGAPWRRTARRCGLSSRSGGRQAEIGEANVYVVGAHELDLSTLIQQLHHDGLDHVLCEGGPTLLSSLLRAGVVDELGHTTTPGSLGGDSRRIVAGPSMDVPASLASLAEHDGTLLHRWRIGQRSSS